MQTLCGTLRPLRLNKNKPRRKGGTRRKNKLKDRRTKIKLCGTLRPQRLNKNKKSFNRY